MPVTQTCLSVRRRVRAGSYTVRGRDKPNRALLGGKHSRLPPHILLNILAFPSIHLDTTKHVRSVFRHRRCRGELPFTHFLIDARSTRGQGRHRSHHLLIVIMPPPADLPRAAWPRYHRSGGACSASACADRGGRLSFGPVPKTARSPQIGRRLHAGCHGK